MSDEQQRVIDLSVEVPGSVDEVWRAIATGPGITSWFVPTEVAEQEGGAVTMDFGTFGTDSAEVARWEPPHRVVFTSRGERPLVCEWLVEARDGGTCVVRLVNSGFGAGADWDADYDGMTRGWTMLLQNLRLHLAHFRGRRARAFIPVATLPGPNAAAFAALCAALGVSDELEPGDRFATSGPAVPPLAGTVDGAYRVPGVSAYLLLLDTPAPGTALVTVEGDDPVTASVYHYLYGEGAPASGDEWASFFASRFPSDVPARG